MTTQTEEKYYLNLCQEIQKSKSVFQTKHMGSVDIFDINIQKRRRENQHLLDLQKLKFEDNLLNRLPLDFLLILKSHKVFDQKEICRFSDSLEKFNSSDLVRIVLRRDWQNLKSLSIQYQVETELLLFIGLNLAQTVLELYAEQLKPKVDHENWLLGNCPVCGSPPAMQKLKKEDGKRMLWCGLCGTEWHFKRIMCPFCSTDDHNSLRYFFVTDDSPLFNAGFRVDVCEQCKIYIKTLDERKGGESEIRDMHMVNLHTMYLDILAQKDGYQSVNYWMIALTEGSLV
jgi:FdhE protein